MAKKRNKELFDSLRKSGVRKKVAKAASESVATGKDGEPAKVVTQTIENLKNAVSDLERQVGGSSGSDAAKKAAGMPNRDAAKRSETAETGAPTPQAASD